MIFHSKCYTTVLIFSNSPSAGIQQGYFYDFSNYGIHDRLSHDGITQWHPAFLALGKTLDACAAAYRKFCKKYRPLPKSEKKNHWGSRLLSGMIIKGKPKKSSPGQMCLPWAPVEASDPEVQAVSEKFIRANCYKPDLSISARYRNARTLMIAWNHSLLKILMIRREPYMLQYTSLLARGEKTLQKNHHL